MMKKSCGNCKHLKVKFQEICEQCDVTLNKWEEEIPYLYPILEFIDRVKKHHVSVQKRVEVILKEIEEAKISLYLHWCIDNMKPVTLWYKIKVYRKHGYIPSGYSTMKNMPSFETWERINNNL